MVVLHPTPTSRGCRYLTLHGNLAFSHPGLCALGQHEVLHQGRCLAAAHFMPEFTGTSSVLDCRGVHMGMPTTRENHFWDFCWPAQTCKGYENHTCLGFSTRGTRMCGAHTHKDQRQRVPPAALIWGRPSTSVSQQTLPCGHRERCIFSHTRHPGNAG